MRDLPYNLQQLENISNQFSYKVMEQIYENLKNRYKELNFIYTKDREDSIKIKSDEPLPVVSLIVDVNNPPNIDGSYLHKIGKNIIYFNYNDKCYEIRIESLPFLLFYNHKFGSYRMKKIKISKLNDLYKVIKNYENEKDMSMEDWLLYNGLDQLNVGVI